MPSGAWIHISVKPHGSVTGPRMMGTPAAAVPGDLKQAGAKEEHHPGIVRRAKLAVDGQAQYVAVEAAAAVQVAGPHQDPAAQNVHAAISAAR